MSTHAYYNALGQKYKDDSDECRAAYHAMRLDSAESLVKKHATIGNAFDYGCGTGDLTERLIRLGFKVSASDLTETMASITKNRTGVDVQVGGLDPWWKAEGKYSVVVALNVLPYMSAEEEAEFFDIALNKAETVIVSHTNFLFDIVSFNRYTVEFYRDNILPSMEGNHDEMLEAFKGLLKNPNLPKDGKLSERDYLKKRRADPFEYPRHLEKMGFKVVEEAFISAFPLPPQLAESRPDWEMARFSAHEGLPETLKRIFCSQFQLALKVI